MMIPGTFLRKLYTHGSLKNTPDGAQFCLKNRLKDAEVVGLERLTIDGRQIAVAGVRLHLANHPPVRGEHVDASHPLPFPLRSVVTVQTSEPELVSGRHELEIAFETRPFGKIRFTVEDVVANGTTARLRIPRDESDDYAADIVRRRQEFV